MRHSVDSAVLQLHKTVHVRKLYTIGLIKANGPGL